MADYDYYKSHFSFSSSNYCSYSNVHLVPPPRNSPFSSSHLFALC